MAIGDRSGGGDTKRAAQSAARRAPSKTCATT